jgi:hypothetical protein
MNNLRAVLSSFVCYHPHSTPVTTTLSVHPYVQPFTYNLITAERIIIKFDIAEFYKKKVFGPLWFSYKSHNFTDHFIKWDCLRFWVRDRSHPCSTHAPNVNSSAMHCISYYSLSTKANKLQWHCRWLRTWDLRSSRVLRSAEWYFLTNVSGHRIGPIFKVQEIPEEKNHQSTLHNIAKERISHLTSRRKTEITQLPIHQLNCLTDRPTDWLTD